MSMASSVLYALISVSRTDPSESSCSSLRVRLVLSMVVVSGIGRPHERVAADSVENVSRQAGKLTRRLGELQQEPGSEQAPLLVGGQEFRVLVELPEMGGPEVTT